MLEHVYQKSRLFVCLTTGAVLAMHGAVGVWLSSMPAATPVVKHTPLTINFVEAPKKAPETPKKTPEVPPKPVPEKSVTPPTPKSPKPPKTPTAKPKTEVPTNSPAPKVTTEPKPNKPASTAPQTPPKPLPKPEQPSQPQPPQAPSVTPKVPTLTKSTATTTTKLTPVVTAQKSTATVQQNSTQSPNKAPSQQPSQTSSLANQALNDAANTTTSAPPATAPTATAKGSSGEGKTVSSQADHKSKENHKSAGEQVTQAETTAKKQLSLSSAEVNASWAKKPDLSFSADEGFNPKNKTVTAQFSFDEQGRISNVTISSTGDKAMDRQIKRRFASARLKAQGGSGTASVQLLIN